MRKFLLPAMMLIGMHGSTQLLDVKTPAVLPPSPEAASIVKASIAAVTLNTGAANTNVPFYELKMKNFSVPIGLSYSTNGVKVDEVPGRAGMGWAMSGTGVVTRSVQGAPDDVMARLPFPDGIPTIGASTPYIDFLNKLSTPSGYDDQPDEFMIAAPGISAKFILNDQKKPVLIPFSNIKIEVTGGGDPFTGGDPYSEIKVTNTNGVVYYFGGTGAYENTITHNVFPFASFSSIRTGFFLTKIKSPEGDSVVYTYSSLSTMVHSSVNFSYERPDVENNIAQFCPENAALACTDVSPPTESLISVNYATRLLTGISASNGTSISFAYQNRNDNSQDKLLQSVTVSNGDENKLLKCYYTEYSTSIYGQGNSLGSYNKRFFLTKVSFPSSTVPADSLRYTFEYDNPEGLSPRLSYAQDYWGYFNAKSNLTLLPRTDGFNVEVASAEREPSPSVASWGALTKVNLPTGGYEQFIYEPNLISKYTAVNTERLVELTGSGDAVSGWKTYYSTDTIKALNNIIAKISLNAYQNPGCSGCTPTPPNTMTFLRAYLITPGTDSIAFSQIMRDYTTINWSTPLDSGKVYILKLMVNEEVNAGTMSVRYDNNPVPVYKDVDQLAGGIRVKQINRYDPVEERVYSKYYRYTKLNQTLSSAISTFELKFTGQTEKQSGCGPAESPGSIGQLPISNNFLHCKYLYLNSNPAAPINLFGGNHLGYTSVIESDSPDMINGGIQHEFAVIPIFSVEQKLGFEMLNLPTETTSTFNGYEISTRYFDKDLSIKREVLNYYEWYPQDTMQQYVAVAVRQRFPYYTYIFPAGQMEAFDVAFYTYKSDWVRLDSTIQNDYDYSDRKMTVKTTYQYGSSKNIQPAGTTTVGSNADAIVTQLKYPTDMSTTAPYSLMVQKNMIADAVEQKLLVSAAQTGRQTTDYNDWTGTGAILKPQYVKTQRSSTDALESRLQFFAYDNSGNPVEFAKDADAHAVYIWDYKNSLPIAEVKNATNANVAFTSFEADGKGNFTFTGTPAANATAPGGKKVYNLGPSPSVPITKSGLTNGGKYTISYWSNSGSYTIGGVSANTSQAGRTLGNWKLYVHQVTANSTSITISGSGLIDEVRLYPQDAQMVSYTYSPLFGITSQSDVNNRITYYSYDGLGRLQVIKDQDGNIIKTISYYYKNGN